MRFANYIVTLQEKPADMDTTKTANVIFDDIRKTAKSVLPPGSSLYLYGSRARGDFHADSDWDLLVLLDKKNIEDKDYDMLYEFNKLGVTVNELFIPIVYTKEEWNKRRGSAFYHNVETEKIILL